MNRQPSYTITDFFVGQEIEVTSAIQRIQNLESPLGTIILIDRTMLGVRFIERNPNWYQAGRGHNLDGRTPESRGHLWIHPAEVARILPRDEPALFQQALEGANGNILMIGNHVFDLTEQPNQDLNRIIHDRLQRITEQYHLAYNRFQAREHQLRQKLEQNQTMPEPTLADIQAGMWVFKDEEGRIGYILPFDYNPQFIYYDHRNHTLATEDVELLHHDDLLLHIRLSHGANQAGLMTSDFDTFVHYHGSHHDCTGLAINVTRDPATAWSWQSEYQTTLKTINADSPMNREIEGKPSLGQLLSRATIIRQTTTTNLWTTPEANIHLGALVEVLPTAIQEGFPNSCVGSIGRIIAYNIEINAFVVQFLFSHPLFPLAPSCACHPDFQPVTSRTTYDLQVRHLQATPNRRRTRVADIART